MKTVNQLEKLHGKFNVTKPTGAKFDLIVNLVCRNILGDAFAHALHLVHKTVATGRAPHLRGHSLFVSRSQIAVPGNSARLEKGLKLPVLGPPLVVGEVRIKRPHECPRFSLGTEVGVHLPEAGFLSGIIDSAPGELGKPCGVSQRLLRRERLFVSRFGHVDHIHVGHVVQLAGSALTHANHGKREVVQLRTRDTLSKQGGTSHRKARLNGGSRGISQSASHPIQDLRSLIC